MKNFLKIIPLFLLPFLSNCTTPVSPSSEPGVITLKVTTEPSARDSLGIIDGDALFIRISNVRTYRSNGDYAVIYDTLGAYRDVDRIINSFRLAGDSFVTYEIGRTWLPPEEFVEIRLSVYPSPVVDTTIDTVVAEVETTEIWVDTTQIPWDTTAICDTTWKVDTIPTPSNVLILGGARYEVEMSDTASPVVTVTDTFDITERDTTEVKLIFDAATSLKRKLDTYEFFPTFRAE
jgi:hypothetical protein